MNFENLPAGWSVNGTSLLIPAAVTKFEQNFPIRVNVKSEGQTVLSRTLLFKFSGSGLFLGDYAYDYIFSSSAFGGSSSASSSSSSSSGHYVQTGEPLSTAIVSTKILRTEYNVLPSYQDLDKIIDSADVVLIRKTIQQVVSSNLNCLAKIGYLADFLGKIESYISIKGFRAADLKAIIEGAKAEILRLEIKINGHNDDIQDLAIPALKTELNAALARLESAYSEYNAANVDVGPFNFKITSFRTELSNAQTEVNKARTQLQVDKTEIEKIDGFIKELEDKLEKAKIERENFKSRVAETEQFITTSLLQIQNIQTQISEVELKIGTIVGGRDSLKTKTGNLEREVDQIKTRIAINEKRENDLISKITDIRIEISKLELDLDEGELDKINEMIAILNNEVLGIRTKIDQLDMQCFGEIDIDVEVLVSNQLMISFTPNQFESFFNGFYGIDAYSNFISSVPTAANNNLNLYGYNIFSNQWAQQYGQPFVSDVQLAYNGGIVTDYSFLSDFQCSNYDNMISSTGTIQNISGNTMIVVGSDGNAYNLSLGACSRINGVNQNYPSVNSNISWRGVLDYGNKYNVHTASCY